MHGWLCDVEARVLDPQGEAVPGSLEALGVAGVREVRVGKLVEVELDEVGRRPAGDAPASRSSGCSSVNPVIEDGVELEGKAP